MNTPSDVAAPLPPADIEAEKSLLCAMVLSAGQCIPAIRCKVGPDSFFRPSNATIFSAMVDTFDEHGKLDFVLLIDHLRSAGALEAVGGEPYLAEIGQAAPAPEHADAYAAVVQAKARLRAIWTASDAYRRATFQGDATARKAALEAVVKAEALAGIGNIAPSRLAVAELLAKYPDQREPIIEGLLRRGEVGNVVSSPKMFKSWLLLHTALCVADGRPLFNFPTRRGRVLLLDYELSGGTLAKRLRVVLGAMNLSADAVGDRLAIESLRGRRMDIDGLAGYFAALSPREYDLIIIDPLYRIFKADADENSNVEIAQIFAALQNFAERLDAAFVVVHHLTKGDQSSRAVTDLGAGGGSQARAADAHLAIRPHSEDGAAVLSEVVRSFEPFLLLAIRWEYPLWQLAADLDPADLARRGRRTTANDAAPEPAEKPAPYTVDDFARDHLAATPRPTAIIVSEAKARAGTERQAQKLLEMAESRSLAFRWRMDRRTGRIGWANQPEPAGDNHD